MSKNIVLNLGLEQNTKDILSEYIKECEYKNITSLEEFEKLFESEPNENYFFIAVGPEAKFVNTNEIAQGLRSFFVSNKIYYLSSNKTGFERTNFIKNGFDDAFLTNIDTKLIKEAIENLSSDPESKNLRPVKLIDVEPDTIVDFNVMVYLPANKKYIKYVAAGQKFEKNRLERLLQKDFGVVFIPSRDLKKFYHSTAQRIRKIYGDKAISETEKHERLQGTVRNIFSNLFEDKIANDFEFGKQTVEECKNMISTIVSPTGDPHWMDNLLKNIKSYDSDMYSHSINVSIYATLLAIGLGLPGPEDFSIAGLFHDLGLDSLPREILIKDQKDMSPQDWEQYQRHPLVSLDILKQKKIIISERIQKMIAQHHERIDQNGFPKKPEANKFSTDSQVFAISNQLEKHCVIIPGKKRLSLQDAVLIVEKTGAYDLKIINDIKKFLNQN